MLRWWIERVCVCLWCRLHTYIFHRVLYMLMCYIFCHCSLHPVPVGWSVVPFCNHPCPEAYVCDLLHSYRYSSLATCTVWKISRPYTDNKMFTMLFHTSSGYTHTQKTFIFGLRYGYKTYARFMASHNISKSHLLVKNVWHIFLLFFSPNGAKKSNKKFSLKDLEHSLSCIHKHTLYPH